MKNKWKFLCGIGCLALLTVGLTGCGMSHRSEGVKGNREIVFATTGDERMSSFHDPKTHKLVGYEVEIDKQIAKGLHRKAVFKEMAVPEELTAIKTGKVDMAGEFSLASVYKKNYLFSKPVKYSYGALLVRAGDQSGIHSWSDIKGKRSAGEAGTSYQKWAQYMGAKLVNYDNASGILNDIANGKADFVPNDNYGLHMNVKYAPVKGLTIAKGLYYRTNLMGPGNGYLINKKDTKLQKEVNQQLTHLKKNGTLKRIFIKYYGVDLSKPSNQHIKYFHVPAKYKGIQ